MDIISEVLTAARVEGAVCTRLESIPPWGFSVEAGRYACFGMVSHGTGWLTVEGHSGSVPIFCGDCFLVAPGWAYALRGESATMISGRFTFSEADKPVLDLLPPLLHIQSDRARTAALQSTLELLELETASQQPGSQLVINRLADVFFIRAVRVYLASDDAYQTGRLRALADPHIGAALKAMHEKIEHPWTVVALALTAGMSRSAFAMRFKELVGQTPLEYLTHWRMYTAGRLLREQDRKVFEVANSVGYDSDGAFNKAFKRVLGVTPGQYRRRDEAAPGRRPPPELLLAAPTQRILYHSRVATDQA